MLPLQLNYNENYIFQVFTFDNTELERTSRLSSSPLIHPSSSASPLIHPGSTSSTSSSVHSPATNLPSPILPSSHHHNLPSPPPCSSRKRSRSTSYEELKFSEGEEDDDVFTSSPKPTLPPLPNLHALPPSMDTMRNAPPFRPYEKNGGGGGKRRFTVPAPLPLPALPPSLASLPSPFSSPHFQFSPHPHSAFLEQLSPFHQPSPFNPSGMSSFNINFS